MNRELESQDGTALVTALMITGLLFAIAGAYLVLAHGGFENSTREMETVQARLAAEDGLNLSIAELKTGIDTSNDGVGNVTSTASDGRVITVTATPLGGNLYRVHSQARLRRANAAAEVVVERFPT